MTPHKRIIVTGASGFLGAHLCAALGTSGHAVLGLYKDNPVDISGVATAQVNICNANAVMDLLDHRPDIIIHCAAATNIGQCERHPDLATAINVDGTRHLLSLAEATSSRFLYLSTDAVFDGRRAPYIESAPTQPLSVYGRTKQAGEQLVADARLSTLIVRTHIFGAPFVGDSATFSETVLTHGRSQAAFTGFGDVASCPIYVGVLVDILIALLDRNDTGYLHVVGNTCLSKYAFARRLLRHFGLSDAFMEKGSVRKLGNWPIYAEKLDLKNDKLQAMLPNSVPSLDHMIERYRHDRSS